MSGTDIASAERASPLSRHSLLPHPRPTRLVNSPRNQIQAPYSLYQDRGARYLLARRYAMPGSDVAHGTICLRACA
eukprot:3286510-Rhodomonas_salina.1